MSITKIGASLNKLQQEVVNELSATKQDREALIKRMHDLREIFNEAMGEMITLVEQSSGERIRSLELAIGDDSGSKTS